MGSATAEEDSGCVWTRKPRRLPISPIILLYFPDPDETGECVALMTTHVDDLLIAHTEKGRFYVDQLLGKFEMGSLEQKNFRYCGKQFSQDGSNITIDVSDNTRKIRPVRVRDNRRNADALDQNEMTHLRSITGSLASHYRLP